MLIQAQTMQTCSGCTNSAPRWACSRLRTPMLHKVCDRPISIWSTGPRSARMSSVSTWLVYPLLMRLLCSTTSLRRQIRGSTSCRARLILSPWLHPQSTIHTQISLTVKLMTAQCTGTCACISLTSPHGWFLLRIACVHSRNMTLMYAFGSKISCTQMRVLTQRLMQDQSFSTDSTFPIINSQVNFSSKFSTNTQVNSKNSYYPQWSNDSKCM